MEMDELSLVEVFLGHIEILGNSYENPKLMEDDNVQI